MTQFPRRRDIIIDLGNGIIFREKAVTIHRRLHDQIAERVVHI